MKKRVICLLSMVAILSTTLCGCNSSDNPLYDGKSREDIISMHDNLIAQYDKLQIDYDALNTMYNGIQSESAPTAAIGLTGDGTGRFTFNSVDSKIIFPASFIYPDAQQATANGNISIVQGVTISPSSNWVMKLNSATLELEHSSGISGTIKIGNMSKVYTSTELQTEVLSQWFLGLPPSDIIYSNITVDGNAYGCQAVTPTSIDSEDAYLRCGMFASGSMSVTYVFVYRGDKDINKDEAITSLLNSIDLGGANIIVEQ